tara:strand:+ start:2096 stop:2854 length:759 start_codon:yes stop_codon:yes gene_type:complete
MSWWTSSDTQIKQKHRFFVTIADNLITTVKSVNQPSITFENKTYKMLNHEFKYPGIGKWNDVSIKFVDPSGRYVEEDSGFSTANLLVQIINNTGYAAPYNDFDEDLIGRINTLKESQHLIARKASANNTSTGRERQITTPEKSSTIANSFGGGLTGEADFTMANAKFQNLSIWQIDPDGKIVEGWSLVNPLVKDVKFGDLAYDSHEAVEYELAVQYDWAVHRNDMIGKDFSENYNDGTIAPLYPVKITNKEQ